LTDLQPVQYHKITSIPVMSTYLSLLCGQNIYYHHQHMISAVVEIDKSLWTQMLLLQMTTVYIKLPKSSWTIIYEAL